jgi:hypothetical protein
VNGTRDERDGIPPYHALVEHDDVVALMLINPFVGTVGGWQHTERDFCEAMQAALSVSPASAGPEPGE